MSSSCKLTMRSLILCLNKLRLDSSPLFLLRLAGVILEYMIHLLKGSALGLRHEEEGPKPSKYTEDGEEDIGAVSGVLDKWWRNKTLSIISNEHQSY